MAFAVLVAIGTAGCEQKTQAQQPAPTKTPALPGVPAISAAQMQRIESTYAEAGKIAAEGIALIEKGKQIERDDGRQAANDTLLEAKNKLRKALEMTGEYAEAMEGDALTQAQIDTFLKRFSGERERWLKVQKELGKLHD
jgi:hypothetical protein